MNGNVKCQHHKVFIIFHPLWVCIFLSIRDRVTSPFHAPAGLTNPAGCSDLSIIFELEKNDIDN